MTLELVSDGIPFLVFVCMLGALLWLTHVLLENRRWNRIFKLQTDVHGKLIERFGTSQEVLTYMSTDAGKRFLEATPIAVGFERQPASAKPGRARAHAAADRRRDDACLAWACYLFATAFPKAAPLCLCWNGRADAGLGFIISAGITWVLARHLGLMPESGARN